MQQLKITLKELAPKLFKGLPSDSELIAVNRMSDRITVQWQLPNGTRAVRSELYKNIKGKIRI